MISNFNRIVVCNKSSILGLFNPIFSRSYFSNIAVVVSLKFEIIYLRLYAIRGFLCFGKQMIFYKTEHLFAKVNALFFQLFLVSSNLICKDIILGNILSLIDSSPSNPSHSHSIFESNTEYSSLMIIQIISFALDIWLEKTYHIVVLF